MFLGGRRTFPTGSYHDEVAVDVSGCAAVTSLRSDVGTPAPAPPIDYLLLLACLIAYDKHSLAFIRRRRRR